MGVGVIVDGYSTGRHLGPRFRERGWDCVHVQSRHELTWFQRATYAPEDYVANLRYDGDLGRTVAELARYRPCFVIPGSESGVLLADQLADALDVPGNGLVKSEARRNKYLMLEALRECGVPTVDQVSSNQFAALHEWARRRTDWPLVAKPVASSGTDHVTFCHSIEELRAAYEAIMSSPNFLNEHNDEVLVQEAMTGDEYMVNTVSWDGCHWVTDLWRSPKLIIDDAPVYDRQTLVPCDGHEEIVEYSFRTLDALDIRYGATHVELVDTLRGPRLLEIGARLEGSANPAAVAACLGHDQVSVTVDTYIAPDSLRERARRTYQLERHCVSVVLISHQRGVLRDLSAVDTIRGLESFFSISFNLQPGQVMPITRDLLTTPGVVYLVHEDTTVVNRDSRTIRELERNGLYAIDEG